MFAPEKLRFVIALMHARMAGENTPDNRGQTTVSCCDSYRKPGNRGLSPQKQSSHTNGNANQQVYYKGE